MKKYVEKQEETTNILSDWVGIILDDGTIGVVLRISKFAYHIICNTCANSHANTICGNKECDGLSVKDTINKWKAETSAVAIKNIYCFDSFKEMMQWFTDGIKE
jgi:hypothetical protein